MKEMFSIHCEGMFKIEQEGSVYSIWSDKINKHLYYAYDGTTLPEYSVKLPYDDTNDDEWDIPTFNQYGVAVGDCCLITSDGKMIPGTTFNCEDDCHLCNRYFTFALLNKAQLASIDNCGTAPNIRLDVYDTKTRQYVAREIPEGKLDVCCFHGEPEVVLAAIELIDRYDQIRVECCGSIVAEKDKWITVYDYYAKNDY